MDTLLGGLFCLAIFLAQYWAVVVVRKLQLDERFARTPGRIVFADHMMILVLPILAMALSFAYAAVVSIKSGDPRKLVVPGTGIEIPAAARDPAALLTPTLVANISDWVAGEFDLPAVYELPNIEFVPPQRLAGLRYGGLLNRGALLAAKESRERELDDLSRDTIAIYSDAERTIYISNRLSASVPVFLSVVVHETVHHVQNLAGRTFNCAQEREQLAYAAQERWLALFGNSLAGAFELDGFSLLAKTRCLH